MQKQPGAGQSSSADGGLHGAFSRIARAVPEATAIRAHGSELSYSELDTVSDTWAESLAQQGVGPGTYVPVLLPRSPELVLAVLAVLKTGAAYALLDAEWPEARLRELLRTLRSPLLIGGDDAEPTGNVPRWVPPQGGLADTVGFAPAAVRSSEAACVFFTSGTTGQPKGVVVPHSAILRLFVADTFASFDATTVIPLASATPWDAFALELWGALLGGGVGVVVEEPFLTPATLRRVIAEDGVNTVWFTSSLFNMIVDEDLTAFTGLQQILVGGEQLSAGHIGRFMEHHPRIDLTNGYGPVESTVFASTHRISPGDHLRPGGVPLGVCVPGTRVYVLDGDRQCGRDEEGEICVSGDGLALEYLGAPELTAERFTTVELDGRLRRVYRTGDLGMWAFPDGLLMFRGRADRQVKVRGHRVEPAEIEGAIEKWSAEVASCRVIPKPDQDGQFAELVAFCMPTTPGQDLSAVRRVVAEHLPPYQVPAQVVPVREFPLTDRGKIDGKRLLALAGQAAAAGTEQGPPGEADACTRTEAVVAEVFCSVLGRPAVPRDVSFFDLGGTSLAAGRVCARLAGSMGMALPVSRLYRSPSVATLASWLDAVGVRTFPGSTPQEREDEAPLTSMQVSMLLRDVVNPDGLSNHCLVVWRLEGQVDLEALDDAVLAVHARQEAIRAAYSLEPRPHACLVDVEAPPLRVLSPAATPQEAQEQLRKVLSEPFEPDKGIVWSAALVPIGEGDTSLFGCSFHHAAFDGFSEAVLAEDLAIAYNAESPGLPPPGLARLARYRAARTTSAEVAWQVETLTRAMAGVPEVEWSRTRDGAASLAAGEPEHVRSRYGRLDAAVGARLAAFVAEQGVTRFTFLLTAWAWAMADVLGTMDLAVGVPMSDRSANSDHRAIGCHLATLPVRLAEPIAVRSAAGSFEEALAATRRVGDTALACHDAPMGEVMSRLNPPATGRTPLYQVIFALQDNRHAELPLNGLRSQFTRQPYPDLPTELHCEVWPEPDGAITVEVAYLTGCVPEEDARALLDAFVRHVRQALGDADV
ncbi:AMP-binding protein [Streptomyces sp. NPDC001142]